jgi:hypothetical protein
MKLNRSREQHVADAVIADPEEHTVMDERGRVRSIQAANLDLPVAELEAIWNPMNLERLARTYWKYLSRVTLGLIRVSYTEDERAVVLVARPFVLLRFRAPEYEMAGDRGMVRWRIQDGVLVARRGEGYLEIDVQREPSERPGYARVHVEVAVANFYPRISVWIARWFYRATQARVHVFVTHGFLRSLAKLELAESTVGRFATLEPATADRVGGVGSGDPGDGTPPEQPVTVGDTPWLVVGALAAVAAGAGVGIALALRARR